MQYSYILKTNTRESTGVRWLIALITNTSSYHLYVFFQLTINVYSVVAFDILT